ncbi:MAG: hypothetical protein IH608_02735, partial [Proteobacteria bacterium]|nr:hypothetical protein [Pseudomonadota bacterium]
MTRGGPGIWLGAGALAVGAAALGAAGGALGLAAAAILGVGAGAWAFRSHEQVLSARQARWENDLRAALEGGAQESGLPLVLAQVTARLERSEARARAGEERARQAEDRLAAAERSAVERRQALRRRAEEAVSRLPAAGEADGSDIQEILTV